MCSQFNIDGSRQNAGLRSVPASLLLFSCLCLFFSGCAVSGNSLADVSSGEQIVTNSVAEKTKPEGISETDANAITEAVAGANPSAKALPLRWTNSETGSSGSIVAIEKFQGKHGQKCRGFKTTVDNFMGIAFYNGEACQISAGQWVLSWFKSTG